jgi:chromate transporter
MTWSVIWWQTWDIFWHLFMLSLIAIGGAITVAPDIQRYLVVDNGWLTPMQFNNAIALAQMAPGPNLMFIPLLGWQVALNSPALDQLSASAPWLVWIIAVLSAFSALLAIVLPSSLLTYHFASWAHTRRTRIGIKAFKAGLTPVVIALLVAAALLIAQGIPVVNGRWAQIALTVLAAVLVWRTQLHLLWLIAGGALAGALGWV